MCSQLRHFLCSPRCGFSLVVLCALSLRAIAAQGNLSARERATDRFDGVRAYIRQVMETDQMPSVSVAVARGGKILWEEGFGWANRAKMIPATANTMYSLASISKPFTATGVMRLVDQGEIDLDKPINDYLGVGRLTGLAGDASGATVRRVLSHTSGLPLHYQFFYETDGYGPPSMDTTIARYGILVNPPGEVYQYSNLGFGILGYVAARTSGLDYPDYMRTRVFLPLGLTHTSVGVDKALTDYAAERYDSEQRPIPFYTFDHLGASAVYSSPHDLLRFGMFHLKGHLADQDQILRDSTIDLMQQPMTPPSEDEGAYGLGWGIDKDDHGYRRISHSGGMPGVRTVLNLYPSEDLAIVVLTNTLSDRVDEIAQRIAAVILPKYAEALQKAQRKPEEKPSAFQSQPELLGEWTGTVRTWEKSLPIMITFQPDGDVHVKLADELETLLNEATYRNGNLVGRFTGTIPTTDAGRHGHSVLLNVRLRDGKLSGQVTAQTTEEPIYYALTSYVELEKKSH
jgi:CubicO group peptidase (beta-lactamase class C family)